MRQFLILDENDIHKIDNNEMVRIPEAGEDGCDIIILSEKAYAEYEKFLEEEFII